MPLEASRRRAAGTRAWVQRDQGVVDISPRPTSADLAATAAGLRRGKMSAAMPVDGLLVLDAVVMRPCALSCAAVMSKTDGKAARVAAARKRTEFAAIGKGAGGFDFVPVAAHRYRGGDGGGASVLRMRGASCRSPVT